MTTQPQHALQLANAVRLARVQVRRDIRAGEKSISEVLDLECMQTMQVHDLLCAQHRWGDTRARELLNQLGIRGRKEIRDLTDRQRAELTRRTSLHQLRLAMAEA